MRAEPVTAWTRGQRRLHWATAALILLAFPLGWWMVAVPLRELLLKFLLYQLHKTLGITVFAAVAARLLLRAFNGRPDWDPGLSAWRRRAAAAMHVMLYAMLLATPVLGYLTAASAPSGVPTLFLGVISVPHVLSPNAARFAFLRLLHRGAAILLVVLASAHAMAALENHKRGLQSLRQMWRS